MSRLSESDIILNLNKAAADTNINLSYVHKLFFLRLLNVMSEDDDGYYTEHTVKELAEAVNMPTRTVSVCLKKLADCGVLRVVKRQKPQHRRINKIIFESPQGDLA